MGTPKLSVSAAFQGVNPYCRLHARSGLPMLSMRAGLAWLGKALGIYVSFLNHLSRSRIRQDGLMLGYLHCLDSLLL